MKIYLEQLEQNLKGLKPVYLVAGDEPFQKIEAADKIRHFVKSQGIIERQIIEESGNRNPLTEQAGTMSLFAESRLLEWRFEKSIKKAFGEYIQEFIESGSQDVLLLVAPKLANEKRSGWYKAIEKAGLVVEVWPIPAERMAGWLQARARQAGVKLDQSAIQALIERSEGNLLAAHQDLNMLALLANGHQVTSDNIQAFVGQNARFSIYELSDACLLGQAPRALRMLNSLQAEGVYPLPLVNQLTRECQLLAGWAEQVEAGASMQQVMQGARLWAKRQKIMQAAFTKGSKKKWYALLQRLSFIDKSVKGQADGDVWLELAYVISLIAGSNPFRAASRRQQSRPADKASSGKVQSMADMKKSLGL
ncbi:DNA polymerase III subunit delta [Kangiella sp. TOML190]|uniref:DNA polymerase III subunit delta n=1 Tax=Kangiella sp. TOML190 TaxID=2931351 RepID=UPI00203DEDBA|nr:DNA polymerase III subunit delta [Kangiella sp. TOML190]